MQPSNSMIHRPHFTGPYLAVDSFYRFSLSDSRIITLFRRQTLPDILLLPNQSTSCVDYKSSSKSPVLCIVGYFQLQRSPN